MAKDPQRARMTAREAITHYLLGAILVIGAVALLLRPGVIGKVVALVLAGGAVAIFTRRSRSDATVITIMLVLLAGFYLGMTLTGNADWILERYPG